MPSNLPSSFASAAAGQNANRDARAGRGDGRGGGGDWYVSFPPASTVVARPDIRTPCHPCRPQSKASSPWFSAMPLSRRPPSHPATCHQPIPPLHHDPLARDSLRHSIRPADMFPSRFSGLAAMVELTARSPSVDLPPRLAMHPTLPLPPTPPSLPIRLSRRPGLPATTTRRRNPHNTQSTPFSRYFSSPSSPMSRMSTSPPGHPRT